MYLQIRKKVASEVFVYSYLGMLELYKHTPHEQVNCRHQYTKDISHTIIECPDSAQRCS